MREGLTVDLARLFAATVPADFADACIIAAGPRRAADTVTAELLAVIAAQIEVAPQRPGRRAEERIARLAAALRVDRAGWEGRLVDDALIAAARSADRGARATGAARAALGKTAVLAATGALVVRARCRLRRSGPVGCADSWIADLAIIVWIDRAFGEALAVDRAAACPTPIRCATIAGRAAGSGATELIAVQTTRRAIRHGRPVTRVFSRIALLARIFRIRLAFSDLLLADRADTWSGSAGAFLTVTAVAVGAASIPAADPAGMVAARRIVGHGGPISAAERRGADLAVIRRVEVAVVELHSGNRAAAWATRLVFRMAALTRWATDAGATDLTELIGAGRIVDCGRPGRRANERIADFAAIG